MEEIRITNGDVEIAIGREENEERLVLGHVEEHSADYVVAGAAAGAKLVSFHNRTSTIGRYGSLAESEVRMSSGLRVVGVTRRRGILRRFVELPAHEAQIGDKIIVADDQGNTFKTRKINLIRSS